MRSAKLFLIAGAALSFVPIGCRKGPKSFYPPDSKLPASAFAVQVQKQGGGWEVKLTNNSGQSFSKYLIHLEPQGPNVPSAKIDVGNGWQAGETKKFGIHFYPGNVGNKLRVAFGGSDEEHPYKEGGGGYFDGKTTRPTFYNYDQTFNVP